MSIVWLNGALLPAQEARIDPADRGFLLGDGIFETMRVRNGDIRFLSRHLERLSQGTALLRLPTPDHSAISDALHAVLQANQIESGSLRLTLTRGTGPRGILPPENSTPTLLIAAFPASAPPTPARLCLSTQIRDGRSPLCRIKHLNYLPNILARLEARDAEADDALLCAPDGHLAEATSANLLILRNGRLLTPPLQDGALPGIARGLLIESGLCHEASLTPHDLHRAEASWLVNSLSLRPVRSFEGTSFVIHEEWTAKLQNILS